MRRICSASKPASGLNSRIALQSCFRSLCATSLQREEQGSATTWNARSQLEQQLLSQEWLIEHAIDDRVINASVITVAPDLSTLRGGYFNVDMRWFNDGSARAIPILHRTEDVDALEVPGVTGGPYGGKVEWYRQMKEMASECRVTPNDQPLEIQVTIGSGGAPSQMRTRWQVRTSFSGWPSTLIVCIALWTS